MHSYFCFVCWEMTILWSAPELDIFTSSSLHQDDDLIVYPIGV